MMSLYDEINNLLFNNGFSYGIWSVDENTCEIFVDNGDWKHDHMALIHLLDACGYKYERNIVEEDELHQMYSGDDCFDAVYTVIREVI